MIQVKPLADGTWQIEDDGLPIALTESRVEAQKLIRKLEKD